MAEEELRRRYGAYLNTLNIHLVRAVARQVGVPKPTKGKKEELINRMIDVLTFVTPSVMQSKRGAPLKEEVPVLKYMEELTHIRVEYEKEQKSGQALFFQENSMAVNSDQSEIEPIKEASEKGILEILRGGNGRLVEKDGRLSKNNIVYIAAQVIKENYLREGDFVECSTVSRKDGSVWAKEIGNVNGNYLFAERNSFEEDTPCYPDRKIRFSPCGTNTLVCRCLNLFVPIAKGQRVSVFSPIGTDAIRFLADVAVGCREEGHVIALLIEEVPEDIGVFSETAFNAEVFSTTFDLSEEEHLRIIKLASARAMRLAEEGSDVIFLINSLSNIVRLAQNSEIRPSYELNTESLREGKRIFSLAKQLKRGGSITVFGVVRNECNAVDQYIAEEFNRLAKSRIVLSKDLAAQCVYPPIDLAQSYTLREESLLSGSVIPCLTSIRKKIEKIGSAEVLSVLREAENEEEFLASIKDR